MKDLAKNLHDKKNIQKKNLHMVEEEHTKVLTYIREKKKERL